MQQRQISTHEVLLDTAHDATAKKVHTVHKGYYTDPFVQYFSRDETVINSPLMNHGQWLRVKAVEYTVARFAAKYAPSPIQVLSIGAGMDTLFFRWSHDGTLDPFSAQACSATSSPVNIGRFVEVDLPEMVTQKQHRIDRSPHLKAAATEGRASNGIYRLVAGDLTKVDEFIGILEKNCDPTLPTLIIAEFVLVYFPADLTSELLKKVVQNVFKGNTSVGFFSFDAIAPTDRFGQVMIENLSSRGIVLAGLQDLPTTASHSQRLLSVGFTQAKSMSLVQLHKTLPRAILSALNKVEMVDDWDEWAVIMSHYCVSLASTGPAADSLPSIFEGLAEDQVPLPRPRANSSFGH